MLRCYTGEVNIREGRWGDGDGTDGSLWEDERLRHQQGRCFQEGAGHCVQSEHPVHVEEGIHARVLAWSQVHELLLHTGQTDETWTWTQDVRQGTTTQAINYYFMRSSWDVIGVLWFRPVIWGSDTLLFVFTVRRSLHGLSYRNSVRPSVRLSVRLSHSCTVSTWFDLQPWFLQDMVAPSF